MPKKKNSEVEELDKKVSKDSDEETMGDEGTIDPSIIEDTFSEEFSEYNDVDNF